MEKLELKEGKTGFVYLAGKVSGLTPEEYHKKFNDCREWLENLGYNLIMQDQCDNSILCKKFETDINSCLFATGSFWEGIDIKGEALSNVIITRLPFPVVDAIMEDKASKFSVNESFRMVYLNDMVKKLAQGCGRLIRNNNDKGIICCLDPRVIKYLDAIKNCTPYVNYTNNIDDIISFSDKYIRKLSK